MKRPRVLVVDDEPMMVEISAELLRAFGFDVLTASDGPEALEVAAAEKPDVVLLDIMMPGMDGREVCRRIKQDDTLGGMKVVLNSSLREGQVDWRSTGADGYREKNRDLRRLPAYLRRIVADETQGDDPPA